jgi:hypothetical protein
MLRRFIWMHLVGVIADMYVYSKYMYLREQTSITNLYSVGRLVNMQLRDDFGKENQL